MSSLPLDVKVSIGEYVHDSNMHTFLSMKELSLENGLDPRKILYDAINRAKQQRIFNERMDL